VTPGTLATKITFDGTMEHLNEDLMLRFFFTSHPSGTPICSSDVVATQPAFNLIYEHIGCSNINMPNNTKMSDNIIVGILNKQLKTLGHFFQDLAGDCPVSETVVNVTEWGSSSNSPNWPIYNKTTHPVLHMPLFDINICNAYKFDFMLRSFRTWFVSTNHVFLVC
jgi:hypothetical protein